MSVLDASNAKCLVLSTKITSGLNSVIRSLNFLFDEKICFGIGASVASFIFFFLLGYSSVYFSRYAQSDITWKYINGFIISFMSLLTIYIIKETAYFL